MVNQIDYSDLPILNQLLVVAKPITRKDGSEDIWVKGSLQDILDYYIPEGASVVTFSA